MLKKKVTVFVRIVAITGLAATFVFTGLGVSRVAQASTPGEACMFFAPYGAEFYQWPIYFGHVGWGYRNGAGNDWVYGADEHGANHIDPGPPSSLDAWSSEGTWQQMLNDFGLGTHNGKKDDGPGYYQMYRCGNVSASYPAAALSETIAQYTNGYQFYWNTCLTKAIAILQAYGANLPAAIGLSYSPDYYFHNSLPSGFGARQYITTLTVGVKVVDPLDLVYLNTNPVHKQRPMQITVYNSADQVVYNSGPFSSTLMATVTPGTDRYQATVQLPPNPTGYHGQWSTGGGSSSYTVSVKLQYTESGDVSTNIRQGASNTAADAYLTAGDVNGNGLVDITDYNQMMECFSDLAPPVGPCTSTQKVAADLDDDGAVNGTDYNEMLRIFKYQGGPYS